LGSMGGVLVSLLLVFSIIYAMYVTTKKTRGDAANESRDINKSTRDSKRDEHEDTKKDRYTAIEQKIVGILNRVNDLDASSADYEDNCDTYSNLTAKLMKKLKGAKKGDQTPDGDQAYNFLKKAKNALKKNNKGQGYDYLHEAQSILDEHQY